MPYKPTLKDIQEIEKNTYSPTLKDISSIENQNTSHGLLDFINNLGGGTATGLQNLVTKPLNLIGNITHNPNLQNINSYKPPFYNPNTLSSGIGRFIGETIPETALAELGIASKLASPALKGIPKAGNFLNKALSSNKALDYATIGGLTSPDNPLAGAAIAGTVGGGINNIGNKILSKAERLKQEERMPTINEEAASILQRIHPNKTLSKTENEEEAAHIVRSNYQNLKKQFNERYNNIFEPFKNMGGNELIETTQLANQLKEHDEDLAPLKTLLGGKNYIKLIEAAKENSPKDINKLQELQSEIGNISSDLKTDPEGLKRRQGYELGKIRESILNDMQNALSQKGLGNEFSNVRNDYRLKLIPYRENKPIRDVVLSSPDQISNFDKLKEAFGSQAFHKEVANQGGNKLKNSIIFDALSDAIPTNKKVDAEKLVTAYDNLGKNNKESYITPEFYNMIEKLRSRIIEKNPKFSNIDRKPPDSIKNIGSDFASTLGSSLGGAAVGGLFGHPILGGISGASSHGVLKDLSQQKIPTRLLNLSIQSPTIQKLSKTSKILPFLINQELS